MPGLSGSYGVRRGDVYEPAAAALPEEQAWSTEAYLDFTPGYLARVRAALPAGGAAARRLGARLVTVRSSGWETPR
ncbi:MAG: hypothetical protein ABW022_24030 [Actinoplanes sp.]